MKNISFFIIILSLIFYNTIDSMTNDNANAESQKSKHEKFKQRFNMNEQQVIQFCQVPLPPLIYKMATCSEDNAFTLGEKVVVQRTDIRRGDGTFDPDRKGYGFILGRGQKESRIRVCVGPYLYKDLKPSKIGKLPEYLQ